MKIIRGRLKPQPGTTYEFISVKSRIKALIEKARGDNFDFVIDDGVKTSVVSFGPEYKNKNLIGKEVPIIGGHPAAPPPDGVSNDTVARFNEDGTIDIVGSLKEEALPRKETVEQLKKIRKATKGIDIGDRVSKMYKQGSNIHYIQNPIDSGIESYEDFEKKNKQFIPSWNLKHLTSPFRGK